MVTMTRTTGIIPTNPASIDLCEEAAADGRGEEKRGRKKWNRKMREVDSEKVSCGKQ